MQGITGFWLLKGLYKQVINRRNSRGADESNNTRFFGKAKNFHSRFYEGLALKQNIKHHVSIDDGFQRYFS